MASKKKDNSGKTSTKTEYARTGTSKAIDNPYAGDKAVDAGNEKAARVADWLTGKDQNPDFKKINELAETEKKESSKYVQAYRNAKTPEAKEKAAERYRGDKAADEESMRKYGVVLPDNLASKVNISAIDNPYAGDKAVDAGNEKAARVAAWLTGADQNPDFEKINELTKTEKDNALPHTEAYRNAKTPKDRKDAVKSYRSDNAAELYLKPVVTDRETEHYRFEQRMPSDATADDYLNKLRVCLEGNSASFSHGSTRGRTRIPLKQNEGLTETEKRKIYAVMEQFIKKADEGKFDSSEIEEVKKYLNTIKNGLPKTDISGIGFISTLANITESTGSEAEEEEQKTKKQEEYEKYIAPAMSNPRTYYFSKDASLDDYITAAGKIAARVEKGEKVSEEEKKQLYSILEQFKTKNASENENDKSAYKAYYKKMIDALTLTPYTSSLNPYTSSRRSSRAARPKATMQDYSGAYFISWLKDKARKAYDTAETSEQQAIEQEEYDEYIAPVLSNPRTYYFPKDASAYDYLEAAKDIIGHMYAGSGISNEEKAQLYSIVTQYKAMAEKDPANRVANYKKLLEMVDPNADERASLFSNADRMFLSWLQNKVQNEVDLATAEEKLKKAEEKNILWSGENSEGEKITLYRDKNFFNSNWKVGNYGIISSRMGDLYAKTGDKRFYDVALKFKQLSEGVAGANYEDINPDNIVLNTLANGIQNTPLQIDQLKETGKIGAVAVPLALIAVASGYGTIAGALQVAFHASNVAGSAKSGFEVMRGEAMVSLTEMGLSYDDALKLANNEGFINAFIESADAVLDIISYGAGKAFSKQAVTSLTKGVKKGAARTAATALTKLGLSEKGVKLVLKGASAAGAFALDELEEGAEEWMQTSVSMANEDAAKDILSGWGDSAGENIFSLTGRAFTREYTEKEKQQRWDDFWGGVKGGIFFSGARIALGAAGGTIMNFAGNSSINLSSGEHVIQNNLQESLLSETADIKDKDVQKARNKIINLIGDNQEVRIDEWGKLYNLSLAAKSEDSVQTLKEKYRNLGETTNLTFEQAEEAMAQDPAAKGLDSGDAFLAFTQGRYQKKNSDKKRSNVETESAKAAKKAKAAEESAKGADSFESETAEKTETPKAGEAHSETGKKYSGANKEKLFENIPEENKEEAEYYYGLGRTGEEMNTIYTEQFVGGKMSDIERAEAWAAGKNDRKLFEAEVEKEADYGLSKSDETRINLKDLDPTTAKYLDAAAKKLGVTVEIKSGITNEAGKAVGGFATDGTGNVTFTMNAAHKKLKGKALARYLATHEFTHAIRIKSIEAYNKLLAAIGSEIITDERIKEKIEEYAKSGIEIDSESAREEIVAEYIGEALAKSDRKTLHKIIGDKRNVAEVLLDMVNKLIDLFRNDKELRKGYEKAREAIVEAINNIDKERAARHEEGRTESTKTTENVKYAVNYDYTFNKQVDDAVSGKMKSGYSVFVGKTPNLLEKAGLEQRPMLINQAHLRDIVHEKTDGSAHYHGIDINIIKQLPKLLKNPVAIYDSISNNNGKNSICVVTSKLDGDGNPIIVSIRSSESNVKYYDVSFNTVKSENSNYATSVYGKDNFRYHFEAILDNDALIFSSKSEIEKLLNKITPRLNADIKLQLLDRLDSLGYNTIIHKSNNVVNTQYMQKGKKYAVSDDQGAEKITADDVKSVQSVGRKSVNDFSSEDIKKTENFARKYFKEMGTKSPFFRAWFGDWRANDTTKIKIADKKGAVRGKTKNLDTGWEVQISRKVFDETKAHSSEKAKSGTLYLDYINSIVENAVLLDSYAIPEKKAKSPNSVMMHSLYAIADMGNGPEILKLYIEELNDVNADGTMKRAYQLQNIENQQSGVIGSGGSLSHITQTADIDTIADLFAVVKQKDKNFNPKPSSTLVNEDGTPKVFYHGTDAEFTVFDRTKGRSSMDIQGMFFSPWEIDARGYGGNVGEYYLSIKNPAPEGIAYKALKMFAGQNYAGIKAREYLEKLGYDGVNNSDEEIIAFYSNQIKSATDNIGTFDKGNNDIRYAVSDDQGAENGKASDGGDEKKEKYFKPGSNRARDIDIVSKTEDGKKNHRLMRNLAESQFTSEEAAKDIAEEARSGNYSYSTYSDKAAASAANRWFSSHGNDVLSAANDILSLLKDGKVKNKTDVAKTVLINNILEEKRLNGEITSEMMHLAEEIRTELYRTSGETAQALQAYGMFKKLSPEGEVEKFERDISSINEDRKKRTGDKRWDNIEKAEKGLKRAADTRKNMEDNTEFIGKKLADKEREIKEAAKTRRAFNEIDKAYAPIRDNQNPEADAKKFKNQVAEMKKKADGINTEWLEAYNDRLAEEFSEASKRLAEARKKRSEAVKERKALEEKIERAERNEYKTFWETELYKEATAPLNEELSEAKKRLAEANAELKKARDEYSELVKEVNRVKATMARREKMIALRNKKIEGIKSTTAKLISDYNNLLKEQAKAETELTQAKKSEDLAKELFNAMNSHKFKGGKVVLSEEIKNKMLNAKTDKEREDARKLAIKNIAEQLPPSVWESLRAWRYLSMLGNLRTHIRNITGNVVQLTAVGIKNVIAGGISDIVFHGEGNGALNEYMEFLGADGGIVPAGKINVSEWNAVKGKDLGSLTEDELSTLKAPAQKYYEEMGTKSPLFRAWFGDQREFEQTEVETASKARRDEKGRPIVSGEVKNTDTGWSIIISPRISEATSHKRGEARAKSDEYMPYIRDAAEKAVLINSKVSDGKSAVSSPINVMEHALYAPVAMPGKNVLVRLTVEEKGGESGIRDYVLKDVTPLKTAVAAKGKTLTVADIFALAKNEDNFKYKKADEKKIDKDGNIKAPRERYNTLVKRNEKGTGEWIDKLWEEQKKEITSGGSGKYKGIISDIEDARGPALPGIIGKGEKASSAALELEDRSFLYTNFVIAMRQYLAANGLSKSNITDEQLTKAIEHATKEAREATYRDINNLARFFRDVCKKSKAADFFISATIPFTTTPFNIVKRAVEYSPLEFLAMTKKGIEAALGKGEYSAADVINDIAKATTGTGLAALGAVLYAQGHIVIGDGSDDDDEYKKELGMQAFSVIIGGKSFTLDWASPAVIPFFMGAQIAKLMGEASTDGELTEKEKIAAIETSIDVLFAPMLQMSVLTSLTDTAEAFRSEDTAMKGIAKVAMQAVTNYLGQYMPTALGQIARTIDPSTRRTVFVQKDAPFSDAEYFLKKQMGKIPGLSRLNPEYVDLFGETAPRKEGFGDYAQSALSNMVYPWYMADVKRTESDDELIRLSDTAAADGKKVLNYRPKRTVNIDIGGHTEKRALTEDEYFEIKKKMGQYGTAAIRTLIKSDVYKDMSDEARAEATDFIWSTAETKAKADVVSDFYMSKEERIAQTLSGGDPEKLALWSAALAKEKLEEEEAKPDYTAEQQRQYDASVEERYSALSDEFDASPYWGEKNDDEKRDALGDLYGYAVAKARSEIEEDYELKGTNKKLARIEETTGLSPAEYLAYKLYEEGADEDGSGTLNQKERGEALKKFVAQYGIDLSDAAYIWQMETDGVTKNNPYGAYLDPKYYKGSGKEKKTWDK